MSNEKEKPGKGVQAGGIYVAVKAVRLTVDLLMFFVF